MKHPYLALWLLLAAAFVAVVCISVFGPVRIFGYELKDSGISGALTQTRSVAADDPVTAEAVADPVSAEAVAGPAGVAAAGVDSVGAEADSGTALPDTASKRILFFGDSMLDGLYPRLAAYAEENGHELYVVIWYSSTSEVWGRSDRLRDYIGRLRPDFIFVCLGSNELSVKDIASKREKYVKNILADIGDVPYLWIGPPNWKPDTGINGLIAANAAEGSFFRSAGMTFTRKADGAHPTPESASEWMDSVARWMPLHAAHPILLEKPEKATARARRVFVHQPNER